MQKINFDMDASPDSTEGIIRKPGSKNLYVCLRYFGRQIQRSTGLPDTPENRERVANFLGGVKRRIEERTFRFSEAFPNAPEREKQYFCKLEGWAYQPDPTKVLIGDYIRRWRKLIWRSFSSEGKRRDFQQVIEDRLLPYFGQLTFYQLTSVELQQFVAQLKHRRGPKKGEQLSKSRINNIMIPLRTIWDDACSEYHWNLADPFRSIGRHLPSPTHNEREIFLYSDWKQVLEKLDPFYRTAVEVMIMTGLSSSEMAGLRKTDIKGGYLYIRTSVVRKIEKDQLKNGYRKRRIPITKELGKRLDSATMKTESEFLFPSKRGKYFNGESLRKNAWTKALKAAEVEYRHLYCLRHTFAAWSLTLGMDPNRLVSLMGHGTKKMVYEVYGKYVEGLEHDREDILAYMGEDFLLSPKRKSPLPAKANSVEISF